MNPIKTKAKSSSISSAQKKRKYKERAWRRSVRTSLKELKAAVEDIAAKVELIRRRQKKGAKIAGTKGISGRNHERRMFKFKQLKKQVKKKKAALEKMEVLVAEQREETNRMKGEMAEIVQATEDKEAEVELLRLVKSCPNFWS